MLKSQKKQQALNHKSHNRERMRNEAVASLSQMYMGFSRSLHFIKHQRRVNQNQSLWSQHLPRYVFAGKRFRGLKIYSQAWSIHRKQKINDVTHDQLISGPSTYMKRRRQRSDDSILLRHMNDVVGTGPEEHLMSDFEHMQSCLYLTGVVVLRNGGDEVNFFLGLEITKTSRLFEVKNSTDLVDFCFSLYGLENSKPTANPGRRSTVMELATAIPLDGHDYSNFRTAIGKLIFMAPWRPDMQFGTIHTRPQHHDREQAQ